MTKIWPKEDYCHSEEEHLAEQGITWNTLAQKSSNKKVQEAPVQKFGNSMASDALPWKSS